MLKTEDYVPVPPFVMDSPDYKIMHRRKEEIRKFKWIEGEKGRNLSWEDAVNEWTAKYGASFDAYIEKTILGMMRRDRMLGSPVMGYNGAFINPSLTYEDLLTLKYLVSKHPKLATTIGLVLLSVGAFLTTAIILMS